MCLIAVKEVDVMLLSTKAVSDNNAENDQSVHAACTEGEWICYGCMYNVKRCQYLN